MADVFVYGALCDAALLRVVLGHSVDAVSAVLPGYVARQVEDQPDAVLRSQDGGRVDGLVLRGLSGDGRARLGFYQAVLGRESRDLTVGIDGLCAPALVHLAVVPAGARDAGAWTLRHAAEVRATAGDVMARFGAAEPAVVGQRYGQMLVRGAGRVRAAVAAPTTQRHACAEGDLQVASLRQPYARFFAIEEYDLAYRRFDRGLSPVVTRAVFVSGDAVTVLPYDPGRDRVLVIEQFRVAPMARGDAQPWLIEAIAGRIDPGEAPEDCARREALEEAGLTLRTLWPVAQYYPSPGAVTEYLYSYVAPVDLPDGVEGVFGVDGEAEDIRGHLIAFDDLMALIASGEVANAPLILTALWLQRDRARLRG